MNSYYCCHTALLTERDGIDHQMIASMTEKDLSKDKEKQVNKGKSETESESDASDNEPEEPPAPYAPDVALL
jgi:hypothetical protein